MIAISQGAISQGVRLLIVGDGERGVKRYVGYGIGSNSPTDFMSDNKTWLVEQIIVMQEMLRVIKTFCTSSQPGWP